MSFLDLKARTRRIVHSTFAVPCVVGRGNRAGSGDFSLTARLHNRIAIGGDINGQGYATIIEGIQRVIFNREHLATALDGGVLSLLRGDTVTFLDYKGTGQNVIVILDARDPYDGPIEEAWAVGPA